MATHNVSSPILGTVFKITVKPGDTVRANREILILESMKMEHPVEAGVEGTIAAVLVAEGDTISAGQVLVHITPGAIADVTATETSDIAATGERADLARYRDRRHLTTDDARPEAVARRAAKGQRTARANIADLVDDGSFVEYGSFAVAAQRQRRTLDDLIRNTPGDGLVGGLATVNGSLFDEDASRVAVASYDYTVLAGTQGSLNHKKKDRLFAVAEQLRLPFILFAEGGGGRPGDTDSPGVAGLDCLAFAYFAQLSGLVPIVGITSGYCFAGNAALLGCCDVIIATENSNIGMAGPAMIEGGGLGVFSPKEIGPLSVQSANGVVDLIARDDAHAVELAKKYLAFFQGSVESFATPDQEQLRAVIPLNRVKSYDVRSVINLMFDVDSVLELRSGFGLGMITALARVNGKPIGVIANNPHHLAGAIDSDGADKAARFMQLCDAFDIPLVTLVDTPGMMVGPEVEETALVRHCSRLFVTGVNITVPVISIVLRKSYGLGAQAMMAGSTKAPLACVAWPTGEFGGMGLEGAVRLGYRKELEAITDPVEREEAFQKMVHRMYEHGKALSVATHFEIDDVIDPAESRTWISAILDSVLVSPRSGKKRSNIDTW